MRWSDEEDLLNAHIIRVYVVWISRFQILIKIHHLLHGLVKLTFVPVIDSISRILQLADLRLHLVEILPHLVL